MIIQLNNIESKIVIEKTDPRFVFRDLRKFFSYLSPTRHETNAYKEERWDGRLYKMTETGYFKTGLLKFVESFCKKKDIKLTIVDERNNQVFFNEDLSFTYKNITAREYQSPPIVKLKSKSICNVPFYRGIIDAATNAGKDYIMAFTALNLDCKILLIVHNQDLFDKALKFFSDFYDVGYVSSKKIILKDFTVAMQKTLYNRSKTDINIKKYLNEVGALFVDECHRAAGGDYNKLLSIIPAYIRLGFSGTSLELDDPGKKLDLVGSFGPKFYTLSNKFLIDNGYSQKPTIKVYDINEVINCPLNYRDDYDSNVMFSKNRANKIISLIKERPDRQILITVNYLEHGDFLLNKLLLSDYEGVCAFVHGEDKERAQKLQDFSDCKINVLIATMIVKEGLNIPCIRTIMMAQGGKSPITVKQITGRGLRHDGENDDFELIEFYDRGKWTREHSKARFKIYRKEGFDIQYDYVASKLGVPYGKKTE